MKSAELLLLAAVVASVALGAESAEASAEPRRTPNIVLILGDDHGWPYYGFMGDPFVSTPNLDRLAAEGLTFTNAFSSASVCRPALQTLLAGLHGRTWAAQRTRIERDLGTTLPYRTESTHYVTLPRQLRRQGYASFQGGKLWEGSFVDAGFDSGTTFRIHPNPIIVEGSQTFGRTDLEPLPEFLDAVGDQPFFLLVAPKLPHAPFDASADFRAPFVAMTLAPSAINYYANIARLDDVVARTLDELESRGLLRDSLIIYTSDNGWEQGPWEEYFLGPTIGGENGKLSIHEMGFRTPLIFRWPGHVPANQVLEDLVMFEDLHATILEYAGAPVPPDHEGVGLRDRIEGFGSPARSHVIGVQDVLRVREIDFVPPIKLGSIIRLESGAFLRTAEWRYLEYLQRGERALYRIDEDPFEVNDVAADHPQMLEEFAAQTAQWREALAAPAPWMDLMGQLVTGDESVGSGLRVWLEGFDIEGASVLMQVFSDARGYFRIPNVPAGEYELRYETRSESATGWSTSRATAEPQTERRTLDLTDYETGPFLSLDVAGAQPEANPYSRAPGSIQIELSKRDGEGVTGLPLDVVGWTIDGLRRLRVLSGPDGFVVLDQLPTGFYLISTDSDSRYRKTSRWVYLRSGRNRVVEIEVREQRRRDDWWRSWRKWSKSHSHR